MGVARWKITIGRPRKTSSATRIFLRLSRRSEATQGKARRPIVARVITSLNRSHGSSVRGKITESYCGLYYFDARSITYPASFFYGVVRRTSFFTRSDNNLSPPRNRRLRDAVSLSSSLLWAFCYN